MAQFRTDTQKLDGPSLVSRYEVSMLSDRLSPSGTLTDAFGRLRTSAPLTLFDSSHRFTDNGLWATSNTAGATSAFVSNQSHIAMTVDTTSGHEVIRETLKVFSYQPGKSLLVLNTFAMEQPKTNLRQRVGYFNDQNGIFLENDGVTNYFVLRTYTSGAVVERRVAQSDWSFDTYDGSGYSAQSSNVEHRSGIDVSKTNILWFDIEWLGVGDVRCGFVVDGTMKTAHIFHNDNVNTLPYMTTASLPLRYEIKNVGTTVSSSTLRQICSTVISEGGYQLAGLQQGVGTPITTPYTLATAGTYYPLASLRLKSSPNRLDGVVIVTALSMVPKATASSFFNWQLKSGGTTTAGTWVSAGTDSSVEYNITGTGYTGGRILASGYTAASNQVSNNIDVLKEALFRTQLERNGLTSTPYEVTLLVASSTNSEQAYGSIDWEEITR
jgi:hypothetical protein